MAGMRASAVLELVAQPREGGVQADAVQVQGECAHVRPDRHLVVVEDQDERRAQMADLVHRFEGDAAGQRAVADDADHVPVACLPASLAASTRPRP